MIVWINGALGSGKSTLTDRLREHLPDAVVFDPEYLGYALREYVPHLPATSRTSGCGVTWSPKPRWDCASTARRSSCR